MLPPIATMLSHKAVLREKMRAERRAAAKARPDAGAHAARVFFENIPLSDDKVVALYYAMKSELDTEPLAAALIERDYQIALPVVAARKAPLVFRAYTPGDPMEPGSYGELVPTEAAPEIAPDIIVVPLLGFTRAGDRLGYGGGYYDRTLKALREASGRVPLAVGYAFGAQEVDALPTGPLDQRLDWIVTERGAIRCAA